NWISEPPIPKAPLEEFITTIPLGEEQDQFLQFIRSLLTWDREARAASYELISHEWLIRPVGIVDVI
ncbi:hypothetical protein ACJ72_08092, partial [Emergomyces africanus]